ncbi:MAG: family phosphatase [Segetibacter sp.]|nr:family phosphatase [Segetibacter sp.]
MENIKNIIFDLGGIFIDIDYFKTEKAFVELGITNFSEKFTQHHADPLFEDLEKGMITPEQFYNALRNTTNPKLTKDEIRDAWNAMLGGFAPKKLEWLEGIKTKYKIYLFSNTNKIHYDAFQEIYKQQTGGGNFDDYFIKAYYSHSLGLRKPYPEAFQALLKKENLKAAETLFIDDTAKNIEGAKKVGLQTILLQAPKTVLDLAL